MEKQNTQFPQIVKKCGHQRAKLKHQGGGKKNKLLFKKNYKIIQKPEIALKFLFPSSLKLSHPKMRNPQNQIP